MSRLVLSLLLLGACTDPNACEQLDEQGCDGAGRAVRRCVQTDDGLRWQTEPCAPATPTCVEQRGGTATCVTESLGPCDPATFEDSCPDEHTLERCADGSRGRVRCVEGERCGEVPAAAVGEGRSANARHACFAPRDPEAPPALVTYLEGEVHLGAEAPPSVPFRVPSGARLRLGEGAVAVVLVKERVSRLEGPREVDVYELQPEASVPAPWAAQIVEILGHDAPRGVPLEEPLLTPAPSEDGVIRATVGEGVPGASATLGAIEWRCDGPGGCGRTLELRTTGTSARVLWRGNGDRAVRYDGPELELGETYQLTVGDRTYRVETVAPPPLIPLLRSMRELSLPEQMSVVAAVHLWNGSRAAAIATLHRTNIELQRADPRPRRLLEAYGVPLTR